MPEAIVQFRSPPMSDTDGNMHEPSDHHEQQRVGALRALEVLDSAHESIFQGFVDHASDIFDAPLVAISLVDADRIWCKAVVGHPGTEFGREGALCSYVAMQGEPLVVHDVASHPAASAEAGVRFYAGAPLISDGYAIGSLCLRDTRAREFGEHELKQLIRLAELVVRTFELRADARGTLREEERFDLIQRTGELAKVGGWELDLATMTAYWSKQVFKIHDVPMGQQPSLEEAIGFYAPEARPIIEAAVKDAIEKDVPFDLELPLITAKDRHIWVRAIGRANFEDGRAVRLTGSFQDITVQRQAADEFNQVLRAYQRSEQRLELALRAANEGLWDWDMRTNEVYFNDQWYVMLGYEPGELPMVLDTWKALAHPEDLDVALAEIGRYMAGDCDRYCSEHRMRTKGGDWKWILDIGEITERDDEGNPLRMIGVHIDMDRQKRAEEQLERAKIEAEAANRAKSGFLTNMSHEIRTPMTAILGFAEILADPSLDERSRRTHVATIQRNGQHLLAIINDVLDLSKIEAGRMSVECIDTDVAALVSDSVDLLRPRAAERGISLDVEYLGPIVESVKTDPTRLRQILFNIVGNAIKFTEHGGVQVRLRTDRRGDRGVVRLDVIDSGIGIDDSQIASLFEPFSQLDSSTTREYGGTGLGLTISRRLARLMGGEISVHSSAGQGAMFSVVITVAMDEGTPARLRPTAPERALTKQDVSAPMLSGRILLAEDGPDNQRLISFLLRRAGADVDIASDGEQAVAMATAAAENARAYDLILMDIQMPKLDGRDATRQLRARGVSTPIIALTAHAMDTHKQEAVAIGCDDFQVKPIDRHALLEACRRWMRRVQAA